MNIFCFNLVILSLINSFFQGRIIDAETQKPIPYAYIQFLDDGGTYITADANGEFKFEVNENRKKGRIYVRALAYEEATVNFDASESLWLEVKLKPKEIQLDELVVKDQKVTPRVLGQINAPTNNIGRLLPNRAVGFDLGKQKGKLTRLHFSLSEDYGFPDAPIIINLYIFPRFAPFRAAHVIELERFHDFLNESILFENGKAGWNQMDLEPYDFSFEDAYVLFHFISPEAPRFEWTSEVKTLDGKVELRSFYGAALKTYSSIRGRKLIPFFHSKRNDELIVHPVFTSGKNEFIPAVALEFDEIKK